MSVDAKGKETELCDGLPRDVVGGGGGEICARIPSALLVNSSILGKRV